MLMLIFIYYILLLILLLILLFNKQIENFNNKQNYDCIISINVHEKLFFLVH